MIAVKITLLVTLCFSGNFFVRGRVLEKDQYEDVPQFESVWLNYGKMVNITDQRGQKIQAFIPWALGRVDVTSMSSLELKKTSNISARTRRPSEDDLCLVYSDPESNRIEETSVCPWEFDVDYDYNRIPESIIIAECVCNEKCLHSGQEAKCLSFDHPIEVARKVDSKWTSDVEQVTVGCVCSF